METKTIQLEIPEYLTIRQFQKLPEKNDVFSLSQYLETISAVTGIDVDELQYWDLESIKKVAHEVHKVGDSKNEFHSILEWNGQLYGYSHIKSMTVGCYVDLETYAKDVKNNLHKIISILYRPITEHQFDTLKFKVKQKIKTLANADVDNAFDYYELESYNSKVAKKRHKELLDFPVHIALGALSFFFCNANLYFNTIVFSEIPKPMMSKLKRMLDTTITKNLLANTGAGGGLYTHSRKPIYYQYQGKELSPTLT